LERRDKLPLTIFPQGRRWAWTRPWLMAQGNAANYVPATLDPRRSESSAEPSPPTPYDLQDWLPHLTDPQPTRFDALLGDPVDQSQGDVWHRQEATRTVEEQQYGYVKTPCAEHELEAMLGLLHDMGVRGVSVTSPLKRAVLDSEHVSPTPRDLKAANTLRRERAGWSATDTDELGMSAVLEALVARGYEPGDIAIIGRGGVAGALQRAIEGSPWRIAHHASARQGWGDAPDRVCLVINAAGDRDNAYHGAPACDIWLDLHYSGVRARPARAGEHLNGDLFFIAQARAQRAAWKGA
ncbi:MAG: hypothetical protein AAGI01_00750, partial [Myxococcota bacterium]